MEKLFSLSCQKYFSVDIFVYTKVNFIFQKNLKISQIVKVCLHPASIGKKSEFLFLVDFNKNFPFKTFWDTLYKK